jgi:hypothetical protein
VALAASGFPLSVARAAPPSAPSNTGALPPPPPVPPGAAAPLAASPAPPPASSVPPPASPAPPPEPQPPPRTPPLASPPPPEPLHFFARATVGFGPAIDSEQEDLVEKEDYGGGRWFFLGDGVGMLSRHFGVGGFVGGSYRTSQPTSDAPTLTDSAWFIGPEGAALLIGDNCGLLVALQLGFMRGTEQFNSGGAAENAFAYGGEAGLMCLKFPISFTAGALSAPANRPGQAGRSWNMGAIHLSLGFVFHG